tara:strand:- start:158 stop:1075 length:918 start_codon:yes stop_codon:yes gene_type:complete
MDPFFSIIIPTYNDLKNLKNTIKSVRRQTFRSFETIIINDGSTDDTLNFLNDLNFENYKKIHLQTNKGPAYARNIGIKESSGKWICFLDSDDFWIKKKLEILYNVIEKEKEINLICHNQFLKIKKTRYKQKLYSGPSANNSSNYINLLLNGNFLFLSATSIDSKFIKTKKILFNEKKKFISVEDYDLWLKIAFNNGKFHFINNFLGFYLKHDQNLTNDIIFHNKNKLYLLRHHIFKVQNFDRDKKNLWKKIFLRYILEMSIIYLLKLKNYKVFLYLIFKYLKRYNVIFLLEIIKFSKKKIIEIFK